MPRVELLDMRELGPKAGPLHPRVRDALLALAPDEKAIVMLNRRGFAPHLSCASCGEAVGCPHCDVSLVMHRGSGRMLCHHCTHSEPIPRECPNCGSVALARAGAGTERDRGARRRARRPTIRWSASTPTRPPARAPTGRLLAEFGAARGGVLVGTQMVAKGHDFADVVLSVLLDADSTLRYPDFRAEERTFALVSQLAGRSGRGERGGRVLVQTLAPDAEPMRAAAAHDTAGLPRRASSSAAASSATRPSPRLVAIELAGPSERRLATAAERVAAAIAPAIARGRRAARPRASLPAPRSLSAADADQDPGARCCDRGRSQPRSTDLTGARELRDVALAVDVDPAVDRPATA